MKRAFAVIFSFVLVTGHTCFAQQKSGHSAYDFQPRERVVFEDDFNSSLAGNQPGNFPSKWRRLGDEAARGANHCQVQKEDNEHILVMTETSDLEPNIEGDNYLTDSFTLEFDFMLSSPEASVDLDFRAKHNEPRSFDWFSVTGSGDATYMNLNEGEKHTGRYPGIFEDNAWHHLAVGYSDTTYKVYVDQYRLLTIPADGYTLFSFGLHGRPTAKFKTVRLATGKEKGSFTTIITERKFVTNTILFEVQRSLIKPVSMGYIHQLAAFLKANPTVILEIDGHTDDVGDAAANMKLSQSRADEVKKQLVAAGIKGSRLLAKGFGDTRPIDTTKTPEGRAKNRRVEFVKLDSMPAVF